MRNKPPKSKPQIKWKKWAIIFLCWTGFALFFTTQSYIVQDQYNGKGMGEGPMVMRTIWAVLAIFIAWSILDFFLHRLLLRGAYEATAHLWRPTNEMNLPLIYFVIAVLIVCFALTYGLLVKEKSLASGIRFGTLFGLAIGVSGGSGTYIHMPIPLTLAWGWFLGGWIKAIAAGAIVGALIK